MEKIYPCEYPFHFLMADLTVYYFICRPGKSHFHKMLHPKTKSVFVPIQYFQDISFPVAKDKQIPGKWIKLHTILDQNRKRMNRFPHIRMTRTDVYPELREILQKHYQEPVLIRITISPLLPTSRLRRLSVPFDFSGTSTNSCLGLGETFFLE